jgi:hypothetical protein
MNVLRRLSIGRWFVMRTFHRYTPARMFAIAIAIATTGWVPAGNAATQSFVSDTSWTVTDAASNPLGSAQFICLSPGQPPSCPPGATFLTASGTGWTANIASIPGAHWIMAPGITGATPNASLRKFSFTKTFALAGTPVSGTISIAVDDFAQVFVNGTSAGTYGSITDVATASAAQNGLATFNITAFLVSGTNTITIAYENGPDSFAGVTNATFGQNTAGVVFGGTLTDSLGPSVNPSTPIPMLSEWTLALLAGLLAFAAIRRMRRRLP